jgi:hypothetical protein
MVYQDAELSEVRKAAASGSGCVPYRSAPVDF